jgi:hypothetical protein
MHSTDDLQDGYMGSGKRLGYSMRKYGIENHVCEILEHYFTREWLREREAELVCAETLTDPMCMNLKLGGLGGFDHIINDNIKHKASSALGGKIGSASNWANIKNDPEKLNLIKMAAAIRFKQMHKDGKAGQNTFLGKTHTEESKRKMREAKNEYGLGTNNSQYGTCWVTNFDINCSKKIQKEELEIYIRNGWIVGRKIKF